MPQRLINHPTALPSRKITATGIAGVLTAAALGVLHWWSPETAALLAGPVEAFIVAAIATVAGYLTRERG